MKVILRSGRAIRPEFRYPAGGRPHALVVDRRLRSGQSAVVISPDRPDLREFLAAHPAEVVAATYAQLTEIDGWLKPTRAVVVLTAAGDALLSPEDRESLWSLFEVPVFEQVLSAEGELMAWECEAHDALHVVREWPGACDSVEGLCDCGTAGRRVRLAERVLAACAS